MKVKEKIRCFLFPALTIALLGTMISFWVTTTLGANAVLKQVFPIICFILFAVLDFALDKVSYVKDRKWLKPLILVGVAAVILLLLILL